jgi:hypothetical protein
MRTMNKAEQLALAKLYARTCEDLPRHQRPYTCYREFRRLAFYSINGCWMVPFAGMMVGIEADGYTHS